MDVNKIRITNLKRIISENYNNSIHRFAKEIGRHSSQFYNLFRGDRSFGQKLARDLELALKLAPLTLDKSPDEKTIMDKIALIKQYNTNTSIDTNLAKMSTDIFAIEKAIIETHGWQIDKLHGFIMDGESMSPTIPHNSKVLIDTSQTKIDDGKIYTLSKNNEIFIKRVFRKVNGKGYVAKSDNGQDETIYFGADKDINVIGRVLCLLNKML
ncbi:MAG TPA: S24/S26 family peptidase [Aquella sp.]|nr:S24/S26 family peptidase [Aquella sp.]